MQQAFKQHYGQQIDWKINISQAKTKLQVASIQQLFKQLQNICVLKYLLYIFNKLLIFVHVQLKNSTENVTIKS